jgi:hypothetical protein
MSQQVPVSTIVRHKATAPNARYRVIYFKAFVENLRADLIQPILKKYSFQDMSKGEWMDAQIQLDILREIEEKYSFEELIAIGMKAGEYTELPPEIDSIEKFLDVSPAIYHAGLQNCSPGEQVSLQKLGSNHYHLKFNVPFAPFVLYGSTYSILKRLRGEISISCCAS